MFFKTKIMIFLAIVVSLALLSTAALKGYGYYDGTLSAANGIRSVVILDAGHGGFDGGAVASDGTVEKDINLKVALTVSELLKIGGFDVIMTRTTDSGTEDDSSLVIQKRKVSDMKNRLKIMEKYPDAVFVSIHLNKFTASSANGAQVFYSKNNPQSYFLGDAIQNSIVSILQPDNKRVIKQGTQSTYLLYNAEIPAVIVECGFLSNPKELILLKQSEYQKKMAFSIFCGIEKFYNREGKVWQ